MIIRRVFAVILAIVFFVLYVPVLGIFQVNDTAGNPDFYVERLRDADMYNFIYDEAIPAAIDEMDAGSQDAALDLSEYKSNVVSFLEQAIPRQYVQQQTEGAITTIIPYMLGDVDSFALTFPIRERVTAAADAAKTELERNGFFAAIYDNLIAETMEAVTDESGSVPLGLTKGELEDALRTMVPPDWLQAQLTAGIDQIVPYLTMETDHFSIKIDISERIDSFQAGVVSNLSKSENYNSLFDNISGTTLGSAWQSGYQLPIGIGLTNDDIQTVMKQVFTLEWYRSIIPQIVGQVFDYLKGDTASLQVTISLEDRKPALSTAISELADRKLEDYIDSLPVSTPQQLAEMLANPPVGRLPDSRPPGFSYAELKQLLGIDISTQIAPLVAGDIPDRWVFSDSDLSSIVGTGPGGELLNGIRDVIVDGFAFTDESLRVFLGANADTLDQVRQYIAEGFVITDQDLKEHIFQDAEGQDAQDFERARQNLGSARTWRWVLWIPAGLVLIAVGFLGGRQWSSRLMWVAGTLLATALVVLAATPPLSSSLQTSISEQMSASVDQGSAFQSLMTAKFNTMAVDAVHTFFAGVQKRMLILLLVSAVLLAAAIIWHKRETQQGNPS